METKIANVPARGDPDIKQQTEDILARLGIPYFLVPLLFHLQFEVHAFDC